MRRVPHGYHKIPMERFYLWLYGLPRYIPMVSGRIYNDDSLFWNHHYLNKNVQVYRNILKCVILNEKIFKQSNSHVFSRTKQIFDHNPVFNIDLRNLKKFFVCSYWLILSKAGDQGWSKRLRFNFIIVCYFCSFYLNT